MQQQRPNPSKSVTQKRFHLRDPEVEESLAIVDRLQTRVTVLRSLASIGLREIAAAQTIELTEILAKELKSSAATAQAAGLETEFESE